MIIPEEIYAGVKRSMPIPCVDIAAVDGGGRVLMVRRLNSPARGQWWFPGGRVHFLETRQHAAVRKLREETNLSAEKLTELGARDLIIEEPGEEPSHAITTVFVARIGESGRLRLDAQSGAAMWRTVAEWAREPLHPFLTETLRSMGQLEA